MRDERWVNRYSYVWSDSPFHESIDRHYQPSAPSFADVLEEQAKDRVSREGIWWVVDHGGPGRPHPPHQGWKIHVSGHPANAEATLRTVSEYLARSAISFKFALDPYMLAFLNSKATSRGSGGKFMTIYPDSVAQFREVVGDLTRLLGDARGPYVLSDMRYKDCAALYFRYGAFRKRHTVDIMGRKIPVIAGLAGELVPDKREAYFTKPDWVDWPFEDWQPPDPDGGGTTLHNRYEVVEAISFSNSGGVYLARDQRSGKNVVVKEARPFTNFSPTGSYDAIVLLRKEWEILHLLRDTGIAPRPIDLFQEWEHLYLVEEFIEGADIRSALFKRSHPLLRVHPTRRDSARYLRSFFRLFRNFVAAIQKVHARGVLLGDLSARNLLITRRTQRVMLIDFEASLRLATHGAKDKLDEVSLLYTPGFRHMERRSRSVYDEYDDLFSLASIMNYYIYPITAYSLLRSDVVTAVYGQLIHDMGWPEELHSFIVSIFDGRQGLDQISEFLSACEDRIVQQTRTPLSQEARD